MDNPRRQPSSTASAIGTTTTGSTYAITTTTPLASSVPLDSTPTLASIVKPILHRLVQIILDYQSFSTLCKEYIKKLDTNFALVASQRMVELCREIHRLVEKRSPLAEQFMVTTFHQTIKLFNVSVKKAIHGEFGDLDNQFVQLLQQSYQLTTLLKGDRKKRHSRANEKVVEGGTMNSYGGDESITPNRLKSSRSASSIFYNGYTNVAPPPPSVSTSSSFSFRNSLPCPAVPSIAIPNGPTQSLNQRPKSVLLGTQASLSNRENNPPKVGGNNFTEEKQTTDSSTHPTVRKRSSKNMRVLCSNQSTNNSTNSLKPDWQCIKCKVRNERGEKCNMCGEPKQTSIAMQPNAKQTLGDLEPDLYNGKWLCKKCKIPNKLSTDTCVFCSLPRCSTGTQTTGTSTEQRELRSVRRSRSANLQGMRPTVNQ